MLEASETSSITLMEFRTNRDSSGLIQHPLINKYMLPSVLSLVLEK